LLLMLIVLLAAPAMVACGLFRVHDQRLASARKLEQRRWRVLWLPLLPGVIVAAFVVGWALTEPDPADETAPRAYWLVIAPLALLWLRAGARAVRALFPPSEVPVAATVGLLRPRVIVAPALEHALDVSALAAVRAHERAHARRRDPLRIWAAQLASDLQWPSLRARARLTSWLEALELARDEEARLDGADGADLAAGIVAAAQLIRATERPVAAIHRAGSELCERIDRLLAPVPPLRASRRPWTTFLACIALMGSVVLGMFFGEPVVRAVLGG
jgi:Zn-dependent protease with chaperone function